MKILMRLIKKYPLISLIPKTNKARIIKVSLSLLASLLICHSYTARAVDISDDPLETRVESAPTLLMFVLDNSGSMDWEFLTDNTDGKFEGNIEYLFDDPGDNTYDYCCNNTILSTSDRGKWKSQWSGYNKIYYNPDTDYLPWPQTTNNPFANADTTTPKSNPVNDSPTFDLSAEFHLIQNSVIVDNIAGPNFEISPEPGAWALSPGNQWGEYYHWVIDDVGNHWAKWTPDLEFAGEYEVYVYTNNNSDLRRTDVSYKIKHDGNETLYCCHNQKDSDPGWYSIDTYYFAADGSDEYVQLEATVAGPSTYMADAVKFVPVDDPDVRISNGHYYTWYDADENGELDSGEDVYLVNFVDSDADGELDAREYYRVDEINDDDNVESGELKRVDSTDEIERFIPKKLDENGNFVDYRSDAEDLQNFANWYQYYRRRELAAKAVVATSINSLERVKIGLYSINSGVRQPVLPIKVDMAASAIVDNYDAGYSATGSWSNSSATDEYEGQSRYTSQVGATATWTPDLPVTGTYNVYAWWCYWSTRDTNALYTINHADGSDTMRINQQEDTGQWILLGTHNFDAGSSGYVSVTRDGSSTGGSTSADAVMFEQVGGAMVNVDETYTLLDQLYDMDSDGSTPLRSAVDNVGTYFHEDAADGNLGPSPYSSSLDGGACQKAYAIVMTDGYYNDTSYSGMGNVDDGEGAPYEDNYDNTLADIAMHYYNTDLSPDPGGLPNLVPTSSCDTAVHQHMTTYTLSFGVTGTIDLADMDGDGQADIPSYSEDPCFANTSTPMPTWPDPGPSGNSPQKIDDLWHAAVNGRGKFFSASNPEELIGSMTEIMNDISDPASGASVSVNGEELGADTVLFQARYVSGSWVGEVLAFPIDYITGAVLNGPDDILWNSSDKLERDAVTWDNRRIVTYNGADAGTKFRYANLTTAQQDALKEADWGLGLTLDEQADYTLQYIRGSSDNIESLNFRYRTRLLGDIVHCAPVLVGGGVSATGDSIDNDDDGFIDESGEREGGTIFAGGNDGMLHAFNAQNGWERFAYVPNLVFENLKYLKDVSFTHRFFVDLTPYTKEVLHSDTERKTYLVGGLGKGGKGYYALLLRHRDDSDGDGNWTDVWNVDNIGDGTSEDTVKNMVLWEYPRADTENDGMDNDGDGATDEASEIDPDIGYSFSQAYIVKTNSATHRWVVIFGNGYSSVSGNAVLYILDLNGVLIRKIDTGVGGDNGLSTPALIDVTNDQQLDYVYAGDLKGNMWKFDFTDEDYANWEVAFNDGTDPKPLFEAGKPITSKPDVMRHCTQYGYMVVFGTGQFLHNDDRTDVDQQTIYGIWDYGDNDDDSEYLGSFDRGTGELSNQPDDVTLLEQTIVDVRTLSGHDYRTFSANAITWNTVADGDTDQKPNPSNSDVGWYVDFPNASPYEGERVFKAVQIRDAKAFVISFIPDVSPCSGGGNSFLYIINACNGGRMAQAQFDLGNSDDMVLITDPDDPTGPPISVPPTGKAYTGILHEPKIIRRPETGYERLYMSASTGVVEEEDVPAEIRGLIYWMER